MKASKRILSMVLAILMVVSVCSVGFTANAVDVPSGATLEEVKVEPVARPQVEFTCTPITRVAKAVNSVEPGNVIVKSTPSGVPELSGPYAEQAYAGETPVQTTVTFTSYANGIMVTGISCNNETVVLSDIKYSNGSYVVTVDSGTVTQNEDGTYSPLVFTVDYTWDDGNAYQQKCVSYVESIATGGSYAAAESEIQALSGTGNYYRLWASASTRLLGKGVYYEMPSIVETNPEDPYRQYGVYDVSTGTIIENVSVGYNTSLFKEDKTDKPAGKFDQANEITVPGTTLAHVYVDASESKTLADQNIRLDANVGALSDRNNANPYTALADMWVSAGSNTGSLVITNDANAQTAIGLDIPAKADYGVTQYEKNAPMETLTPGAGQYGNIITQPLTGNVADLVDGSSYTITNKYYSYMWVESGLLQHYNMTSSATVPVSMTFHIVDKSVLREEIDYVMNSEPDVPGVRAKTKGANPQAWYYSSGFSNFQTNYVNALNVLNNPKATQTEIDAAASSLNTAYKGLTLKGADYTEVNELKAQAEIVAKNADDYTEESVELVVSALSCVTSGYSIFYQDAVNTMARNLSMALSKVEKFIYADYTAINNAFDAFHSLNKAEYVLSTWKDVENVFAKIDYTLRDVEQSQVDAWANEINKAMEKLVKVSDLTGETEFEEIILEPVARPEVEFTCTPVTRVAKAINSVEPGNVIVKSTPSGVPELSGPYAEQAYAGETPVQTTVTFTAPETGIKINGISCDNETVYLSRIKHSDGQYYVTVESGTVNQNGDGTYKPLVFTVDYTWIDGKQYQQKCVSYVESIATGGSYAAAESEIQALSGTGSFYRVYASASTRLLGKGVYYEMPSYVETSPEDPYRSYGVYDVSTGTMIENVSSGYNTSFFTDDKISKPAGKANIANELSVPGTTLAHVYVDASESKTLADQNIRLNANVGALSDRNNSNPYTALADAWVSAGSNTDSLIKTNDTSAQSAIGLDIPAKADYGVTQYEKNAPMETLTPGAGQYGNIFTTPLTGNVTNLVDGSAFTVTLKYYAYMWVEKGLLQHYNMTSSATVPVSMTFHIVDKSVLREEIDYVMNTEPDVPTSRAKTKGVNPQAWYYSSGFSAFQTAYANALSVLNNPKAIQTEIDAAASSLNTAYKNLKLNIADYKTVNSLKTEANSYIKNADVYTAESIALLEQAVDSVVTGYNILYQDAVDTMARNLQIAINNVVKLADKTALEEALSMELPENTTCFDMLLVLEYDALVAQGTEMLNDETLTISDQARVDKMAQNLNSKYAELMASLSHTAGEPKVENEVLPDCTIAGSYDTVIYCTKCGEVISRVPTTIPELGHDYDKKVIEPTCTTAGYTIFTCKVCEYEYIGDDVPALGHTPAAAVIENEVPATVFVEGSYDKVVYCLVCDFEISRNKVTTPKLNHTPAAEVVIENEKPATCTEKGSYDEVLYCTCCEEKVELSRETKEVPALGHVNGEAVTKNVVEKTCEADGSYDTVIYCTVCDAEVSRVKTTVPTLGHINGDPQEENRVDATCTEKGSYDMVTYCTVCNKVVDTEKFELDIIEHSYTSEVTPPTCTDKGYTTYTCTVCGYEKTGDEVAELGHTPGKWVVTKPAEVGVAGEETLYCAVCGEAIETRKIPAITAYFRAAEGSTTIIDKERGFIYGLEEGLYNLDGFVDFEGGTIEYVETNNGFGTGTVVNFIVDGKVMDSYTVVIFGDLTGDGVIDTYDSVKIAQVANYDIELEKGSAVAFAADIACDDGWVDTLDLVEIYKAVNCDIIISQVR